MVSRRKRLLLQKHPLCHECWRVRRLKRMLSAGGANNLGGAGDLIEAGGVALQPAALWDLWRK